MSIYAFLLSFINIHESGNWKVPDLSYKYLVINCFLSTTTKLRSALALNKGQIECYIHFYLFENYTTW
jgi:hypothetical protein